MSVDAPQIERHISCFRRGDRVVILQKDWETWRRMEPKRPVRGTLIGFSKKRHTRHCLLVLLDGEKNVTVADAAWFVRA